MTTRVQGWVNLPPDVPTDLSSSEGWSFGRGGEGVKDHQWWLGFTHGDLSQDKYVLPDWFGTIIEWMQRAERDRVRARIKTAMGIIE